MSKLFLAALILVASASAEEDTANLGAIPDTIAIPRDPFPSGESLPNPPSTKAPETTTSTPLPKSTTALSKAIQDQHDTLAEGLLYEKKRFPQKYLDCDDKLKELVADIEDRIQLHDHDDVKTLMKQLKNYRIDEFGPDPCVEKEKAALKKIKDGQKNGAE